MDIRFKPLALEQYNYFAVNDKIIFKKLMKLIIEISRNPFEGTGQPEELKHELSGYWSRRIDLINRIVYKVEENEIVIVSCKDHYNIK